MIKKTRGSVELHEINGSFYIAVKNETNYSYSDISSKWSASYTGGNVDDAVLYVSKKYTKKSALSSFYRHSKAHSDAELL